MDETAVKVASQDEAPEAPKSAPKVKTRAGRIVSVSLDEGRTISSVSGRSAKPTKRPSAKRSKKKPKAGASPKKTPRSKPATKRPAAKKPAKARPKAAKKSPKGAGRNPKEWIMSVHIPMPLLAKLDKLIARLKQGENRGASRSSLAVSAIAKLVK